MGSLSIDYRRRFLKSIENERWNTIATESLNLRRRGQENDCTWYGTAKPLDLQWMGKIIYKCKDVGV